MFKSIRIVLLAVLMLLVIPLGFAEQANELEIPTDRQIEQIYRDNPYAIYEMVRFGWVVSQTPYEFVLPERKITLLKNGDLRIDYEGTGTLKIGMDPYSLTDSFELEPYVETGFRTAKKIHPLWFIAGGVGILAVGLTAGFVIGRR